MKKQKIKMIKSVLLCLVVLLITTINAIDFNEFGEMDFKCESTGIKAHPFNCHRFFWCTFDDRDLIALELDCGPQLIFDTKTEKCMSPWLSNREQCALKHIPNILHEGMNFALQPYRRAGTTDICTEEGFVGDAVDCSKFYRCVDNGQGTFNKYEFTCGSGTIWDQDIMGCNHAWAVTNNRCNQDASHTLNQTEGANTDNQLNPDFSPPEETKCKEEGFFPDEKNCQVFYLCLKEENTFEIKQLECGQGMIYDTERRVCVKAEESTRKDCIKSQNQPNNQIVQSTTTVATISSSTSDSNVPASTTQSSIRCMQEGFLADPNDCKRFYRCVDDGKAGFTKYDFTCGQGTVWDMELNTCNYPAAVGGKCGHLSSQTNKHEESTQAVSATESTTKENTTISTTQQSNINEISQASSESAIHISSSTEITASTTTQSSVTDTTPTKLPSIATSVASTSVQPEQITIETTSHMSTSTTHSINDCNQEGFQADPSDCTRFYRCVDNGKGSYTKYQFTCGEGTVWDSDLSNCNYPWATKNANCGGTASSTNPNKFNTTILSNQTTTFRPVTSVSTTSPANQLTTAEIPTTTSQQTEPTSGTTTSTTETANNAEISAECKGEEFLLDPKNCKKFYRCVNDGKGGFIKYEFTCGQGTVWDKETETCNYPWAVENNRCESSGQTGTGDTTSTTTSQTTASNFSTQITESSSDSSSTQSIATNQGETITKLTTVPTTTQTKPGTDSSSTEISQTPTITQTDSSSVSTTTESTVSANQPTTLSSTTDINVGNNTQGISHKCTQEGFLADSKNCKKFYRCVDNGKGGFTRYEFTCGEGTIWDSDQSTCNYPWAVKNNCSTVDSTTISTTISQSSQTTTSPIKTTTEEQTTMNIVTTQSTATSIQVTENTGTQPSESTTASQITEQSSGQPTPMESSTFYHSTPELTTEQSTTPNLTSESAQTTTNEPTQTNTTTTNTQITTSSPDQNTTSTTQTISQGTEQTITLSTTAQTQQTTTGKTEPQSITQSPTSAQTSTTPQTTTSQQSSAQSSTTSVQNVTTTTKKPSTGGQINQCTQEGFHANVEDCRKFYRCVSNGRNGFTKYDFSCGPGTVWDPDLDTCNHEWAVTNNKCKKSSEPDQGGDTDKSKEACKEEGFFGDAKDCKKFYRCVAKGNGGYIKYNFTCGEGTIWDDELETCNYPWAAINPSCDQDISDKETTTEEVTSTTGQTSVTSISNTETTTVQLTTTSSATTELQTEVTTVITTVTGTESTTTDESSELSTTTTNLTTESTTSILQTESTTEDKTESTTIELATSTTVTTESTTENKTDTNTTELTTPPTTTTETEQTTDTTTELSTSTATDSKTDSTTTELTTSSTTIIQTEPTTTSQTITETETQSTVTTETTQTTTDSTTPHIESTTTPAATESTSELQTTIQTELTTLPTESTTDGNVTTETQTSTTESSTKVTIETTTAQLDSTTQTTTENSESTTASLTSTTTESSSVNQTTSCPIGQLEGDQITLVCPTGFKRHPKYCNLFYQCTSNANNYEIKVLVLSCPNGTIYDDSKIQCLPPEETNQHCRGEIAQNSLLRQASSTTSTLQIPTGKILCPNPGSYNIDSSDYCNEEFIKCEQKDNAELSIRGYIYQCPQGYTYWSIGRKCEKYSRILGCPNTPQYERKWAIPTETVDMSLN